MDLNSGELMIKL